MAVGTVRVSVGRSCAEEESIREERGVRSVSDSFLSAHVHIHTHTHAYMFVRTCTVYTCMEPYRQTEWIDRQRRHTYTHFSQIWLERLVGCVYGCGCCSDCFTSHTAWCVQGSHSLLHVGRSVGQFSVLIHRASAPCFSVSLSVCLSAASLSRLSGCGLLHMNTTVHSLLFCKDKITTHTQQQDCSNSSGLADRG